MRYAISLGMMVTVITACGGGGEDPVAPPPVQVAAVTVTASRSLLVTGDSLTLSVEARDAQGSLITGRATSWSSTNPQVATVSSAGLVRTIAEGEATISASVDGRSGSVTLTVRSVILETARSQSVPVGLGGDTITVSSAGGVTYNLEIPAGALEKPITISMTPVTGMSGADFSGGLLGAVKFEPSGLRFLRPVRLRISGFQAPASGRVPVGFVGQDGGVLDGLVPSSSSNGALTVVVPHFSVVGAGAELPVALAGTPFCPAPCSGAEQHMNDLASELALGSSPAAIAGTLAFWGADIDAAALIPGATNTPQLLTAITEYALWTSTIEFVEGSRPDLLGISGFPILGSQLKTNAEHMLAGLFEGMHRNAAACRINHSIADAEAVLFWQDQAEALGVSAVDINPSDGLGDLRREHALDYLKLACLTLVLDSASLAEPLRVGKPEDISTAIKAVFNDGTRQGVPLSMELTSQDATVSQGTGFTDAAGNYAAVVSANASARQLGIVSIDAKGCLVLPTEAAKGALAKASDFCETFEVARAVELYFNDFAAGAIGSEWSVPAATFTVSPSGQRFLGELGNQSVLLLVDSLPFHDSLVVEFDLYMIDSWNGNGGVGASASPDLVTISILGGPVLKRTTFSNKPRDLQAFPGDYPGSEFPARTGMLLSAPRLVYPDGSDYIGDTTYRLRLPFAHVGPEVVINFTSGQTSGPGGERWGIDNVRLSIIR